jgi:selenocysteine lyase/cysteine desulfurase
LSLQREEFPLDPTLCHLNHAAVGPWPARAARAVSRFAEENARQGSLHYPQWLATETRLRERLARLIGAGSPGDIALAKNTSEALSIIAYGLDWESGDEIVGIEQEFPSNRVVWESLADQGVVWTALDLEQSVDPESELFELCTARTRMIAVSWVQYARGLRLDLERIGAFCRSRDILFCVDGIQGLGALPFDVARTQADFVVADGHKWMLGPEGVALLYVRPSLRPRLTLRQFGWHMLQHSGDYDRRTWQPAEDARRFECGSPNLLGIHALEASLSLIEEIGIEEIWREIQDCTAHLIDRIDRHGLELVTPRESNRRAGIITFRVPGTSSAELHASLMKRRVLCAQRGGGIRFSPHFHTSVEVIDRAVEQVLAIAAGSPGDSI